MYKTTFANYQKSKNILVLKYFYNLMKPRVMSLVVFTAFVGLIISNKQVDFLTSALGLFFVALGAGVMQHFVDLSKKKYFREAWKNIH